MLHTRTLKRLFQTILIAAAAPACTGVDRSQFTTNACEGANDLVGVTPNKPVDFMELRQTDPFGGDPTKITVIASQGVLCATASSNTCTDTFNALMGTEGWPISMGEFGTANRFLAFTRGDEVGTITTLPDLQKFVAPVENARDAVFLVRNSLSTHSVICDELNTAKVSDGFNVLTTSGIACGAGSHKDEHVVHVSSTGTVTVEETAVVEEGDPNCAIGRRPNGLIAARSSRQSRTVGSFFASAARLEAASVYAFEQLENELRTYKAPRTLVRDARRARNDEVRHARMTRRLAKKNGASPATAQVRPTETRSWLEFVKENAVEGCIRETFGALVATYQAQHATDSQIQRAMAIIAQDETRHASLSWRIADWAAAKLNAKEKAEIRTLQQAELQKMADVLTQEDTPLEAAGLPGRNQSLQLLAGFSAAIGLA